MDITFNILKLIKINIYSANNNNLQIKVGGFRKIGVMEWGELKYNDDIRVAHLNLNTTLSFSTNENKKYSSAALATYGHVPHAIPAVNWFSGRINAIITSGSTNNISIHSEVAQTNAPINLAWTWTY